MKAAVVERYGPPEVVSVRRAARPGGRQGPGAGARPGDDRHLRGRAHPGVPLPAGLRRAGAAGAGRPRPAKGRCSVSSTPVSVEAVGPGVDGVPVGDEVCGMTGVAMGAHAELAGRHAPTGSSPSPPVSPRAGRRRPLRRQHGPALPGATGSAPAGGCWSTAPRRGRERRPCSSPTWPARTSPASAARATPTSCARSAPTRSSTTRRTAGARPDRAVRRGAGHRRQPRPALGSRACWHRAARCCSRWPGSPTPSWRAGTSAPGSPAEDPAALRVAARARRGGRAEGGGRPHAARSDEIVEAHRVVDSGRKVGNLVVTP